ncbi:MAG: amidohydrolase family protein [Marmoricola sp.]
MYADHLLQPWFDQVLARTPGVELFDCHNHVGENDPSGFSATLTELETSLARTGGRGVVMPAAEPDGYARANATCAEAARRNPALVAFTRVVPAQEPASMLAEGLAHGARGVKLHPASDDFSLEDPRLEGVLARADRDRLPVLVHAGPELEGVGGPVLRLCERYAGARFVLAHCGLTDLGWIWKQVPQHPNLFFDTAWWTPAHLMALFRLVPPGRVLLGSDLPYATPLSGALLGLRCAWQAGLDESQVRSVAGGQLKRLVENDEPLDLGPPPTREPRPPGPLLEVVSSNLLAALEPLQRGEDPGIPLTVARRGCKVDPDVEDAEVFTSVQRLLDQYEEHRDTLPHRNQFSPGRDLVAAAAVIARTPAVQPGPM